MYGKHYCQMHFVSVVGKMCTHRHTRCPIFRSKINENEMWLNFISVKISIFFCYFLNGRDFQGLSKCSLPLKISLIFSMIVYLQFRLLMISGFSSTQTPNTIGVISHWPCWTFAWRQKKTLIQNELKKELDWLLDTFFYQNNVYSFINCLLLPNIPRWFKVKLFSFG